MKLGRGVLFLCLLNLQSLFAQTASPFVIGGSGPTTTQKPTRTTPMTVKETFPTHTLADGYYYLAQSCSVNGCEWVKFKSPEAQYMEDMEAKATGVPATAATTAATTSTSASTSATPTTSTKPKTVKETFPTHSLEDGYYYRAQSCTVNGCAWVKFKSPEAQYMEDMEAKAASQAKTPTANASSASSTASSNSCGKIADNYNANNESDELVAAIFAGTMSKNICPAAGKTIPGSLAKWWDALKTYSSGEKARNENFNANISKIKTQLDAILADKSGNANLQIQANTLQVSLTNLTLQNIKERIRLRSELEQAGSEAIAADSKENAEVYNAYKYDLIANGLERSLQVATDACKRTKKVKVCDDEKDPSTCSIQDAPAPVNGCKEVMKLIPALISGKVHEYGNTYLEMSGPSKNLNDKLGNFETDIASEINAIPASDDSAYDWSQPMNAGIKTMIEARKNAGVICQSDSDAMKKITEATKNFPDATPSMTSDKLMSTFALADKLVGQPYKRADYLKYFTGHLNYISCFDKSGEATTQSDLDKLLDYGKALSKM